MVEYTTLRKRTEAGSSPIETAVAQLKPALAAYAREHGGRFILFGSAARREMRHDSDVDIFVDFPTDKQSKAIDFAERAGRRLGLEPDVIGFASLVGRFGERLQKEGLILPGDEERWSDPMSMEDRLGDILNAARSAVSHFQAAEQLFKEGNLEEDSNTAYRNRMAFSHAMQSAHTALEDSLVRTMKVLGEVPPSGSDWHQQVIERAATPRGGRPAILLPNLAAAAAETRKARHFAMHAYMTPFKAEKARPGVDATRVIIAGFEDAIAAFIKTIQGF